VNMYNMRMRKLCTGTLRGGYCQRVQVHYEEEEVNAYGNTRIKQLLVTKTWPRQ